MWPFSSRKQSQRLCSTRSRRQATRLQLETLEPRLVLTGLSPTVLIAGQPTAAEAPYGNYTLTLTAVDPENDPVSQWTINWDDGSPAQILSGNPATANHTYANGPATRNITASAVVGGESFNAKVSSVGSGGEALPQFDPTLFPGNSMVYIASGPDYNGDDFGDLYVDSGNRALQRVRVDVLDGKTGALLTQNGLFDFADAPGDAHGLTFGPDGNLYVCSNGNGSVLKYDWDTGQVSTFISGLWYPRVSTFDSAGNLYVADSVGAIWKYDSTGQRVGQSPFADLPSTSVADLKFGPDGNLYLTPHSDNFDERRVLKFDIVTQQLSDFVPASSGLLRNATGLAFGPDRNLYVVSTDETFTSNPVNPRVLEFDGQAGTLLRVIDNAQMKNPWGLTFGENSDIYVAELSNGVRRFDGPLTASTDTSLQVTVLDAVKGTYSSGSINKAIPSDLRTYSWTLNVPDAGQVLDVDFTLNITHPNDGDLQVWLISPAGTSVRLFSGVGGSGDNFKGTILNDEASASIASGSAPFSGSYRPQNPLSLFDGEQAKGTWTLQIRDGSKPSKGTLNSWSLTITRGVGPTALEASAAGPGTTTASLSQPQAQSLVSEARARWQAAGADTSSLAGVSLQIADLGGTTLGLSSGNTIFLDDNAAGWGWFVDPTPRDDSEFTTPGDQGEQGKIDLLTVLAHEMGHLLGLEHSAASGDVMSATLGSGVRLMPAAGDLPGSTLAGFSPSHSDDAGKAQPHSRGLASSSAALDTTDVVFAELARREFEAGRR